MAITGVLPAMAFLAYWPISLPAVKLLVANSASAAFWGCSGVSSVITLTPWLRAFWTTGTIAVVLDGTSRMPFAPAATMLLIAVTWLALSPSYLPAAVISFAPSLDAAFWAPSFIFTKNGFVSVFVIRPIVMSLLPEPPPPRWMGLIGEYGWDHNTLYILERDGRRPKFIYTVPNFHNPAGVTMSLERRRELVKVVRGLAEDGKISVRNVRRDIMHDLKSLKDDGDVGADDERRGEQELQKLTDANIADLDALLKGKEEEILEV